MAAFPVCNNLVGYISGVVEEETVVAVFIGDNTWRMVTGVFVRVSAFCLCYNVYTRVCVCVSVSVFSKALAFLLKHAHSSINTCGG